MSYPCIVPKPNRCRLTGDFFCGDVAASTVNTVDLSFPADGTYRLHIRTDAIAVTAADARGFFYAAQTLRQLAFVYGTRIPTLEIDDAPAFAHRGFMVDSVRHMQSIDELKMLIDAAALFKFNVFHWHISDDQGFRFESETYPELTRIASVRPSSDFGKVHDNTPYGGYYTKDEMREIIAFCHDRFITVIPEIDLPGHTCAILHAKPELSCKQEAVEIKTTAGIFDEILCCGKEATFDFLFGLLDEICEVFPDPFIHIGGDEAPKTNWKTCPDCQKRMQQEGLSDEEQLQGYMTVRIAEHLRGKGRQVICWNETLASDILPEGLIIQNWMDKKKQVPGFVAAGGRTVYSDYYHYYTDYPYPMTPVKKTYTADPFLKGLSADMRCNCIGVETPIWTEHVRDFSRLCYMTWPRFAAVSETGWTNSERKNYADFKERMITLLPLLEEYGIYAADPKEWDPTPVLRLPGTLGHFAGTVSKDMVINFFKDTFKKS